MRRLGDWMPAQVQLLRVACGLPGSRSEERPQRSAEECRAPVSVTQGKSYIRIYIYVRVRVIGSLKYERVPRGSRARARSPTLKTAAGLVRESIPLPSRPSGRARTPVQNF